MFTLRIVLWFFYIAPDLKLKRYRWSPSIWLTLAGCSLPYCVAYEHLSCIHASTLTVAIGSLDSVYVLVNAFRKNLYLLIWTRIILTQITKQFFCSSFIRVNQLLHNECPLTKKRICVEPNKSYQTKRNESSLIRIRVDQWIRFLYDLSRNLKKKSDVNSDTRKCTYCSLDIELKFFFIPNFWF